MRDTLSNLDTLREFMYNTETVAIFDVQYKRCEGEIP